MISLQVFCSFDLLRCDWRKRDTKKENVMSFTQTVEASKIEAIPAPFPKTKGNATLKVLNSEQSLGPAVALLRMEPGSEIPRHLGPYGVGRIVAALQLIQHHLVWSSRKLLLVIQGYEWCSAITKGLFPARTE
jgi:hypothetical protein